MFERLFGGLQPPAATSVQLVAPAPAPEHVPVRYRPRLVADLLRDHAELRTAVRGLLDACRGRDEDARVFALRAVAAKFRGLALAKSVHLYPYLLWALANDRFATIQLKSMRADVERSLQSAEAILEEYLGGPWLQATRSRLVGEAARLAHLVGPALVAEEASVFPLYLPPGHYRHVHAP